MVKRAPHPSRSLSRMKDLGRFRRNRRSGHRAPPGAPPGTLVAHTQGVESSIAVIAYTEGELRELSEVDAEDLPQLRDKHSVLWVDVVGLRDAELVRTIGEMFELHPLALEDVLNVEQRPKLDDYGSHLFIVTRIASDPRNSTRTEQISMFVAPGIVITFQERPGDCFEPVRERIRHGRGRIRRVGADYLAYALLDSVVDHYFPIVDAYSERLDRLEDSVLANAGHKEVTALLDVRHDLLALRRVIYGLRDVLAKLLNPDLTAITEDTLVYLRDGHDHALRLLADVDGWRELSASLMEVHRSVAGQQLNSVMKVLTIIATIFIPLSFIAGLYGMNFDPQRSPFNMPELSWYFGYPFALFLMFVVAVVQLVYFRRRGWLSSD